MICITSIGSGLDNPVDSRFGRCQFFLIVDDKGKLVKAMPNPGTSFARGAGVAAAQTVVNEGAKTVITGNVGPNSFMVLAQSAVKIYLAPLGSSAKQALDLFNQGKLTEAQSAGVSPGQVVPPPTPGRRGPGQGRRRGR